MIITTIKLNNLKLAITTVVGVLVASCLTTPNEQVEHACAIKVKFEGKF